MHTTFLVRKIQILSVYTIKFIFLIWVLKSTLTHVLINPAKSWNFQTLPKTFSQRLSSLFYRSYNLLIIHHICVAIFKGKTKFKPLSLSPKAESIYFFFIPLHSLLFPLVCTYSIYTYYNLLVLCLFLSLPEQCVCLSGPLILSRLSYTKLEHIY